MSNIALVKKEERMPWYYFAAYFVAGCLVANGVPHFVNGISGRRFTTPFASPPFAGESSPLVNVIWGLANFAGAFLLVIGIGDFRLGFTPETLAMFAGAALVALGLSLYFPRAMK